jgi:translation initiation factor 3 subunit K
VIFIDLAWISACNRYNPENLPVLEDYVRDQMLHNNIDRTANLAVLKLYQFNPSSTNLSIVVSVLALSVANLPDPDFNLAQCLLTEEITQDSNVSKLLEIQHMLERCRFKEFWEVLENDNVEIFGADEDSEPQSLLTAFPEFDNRIRRFISTTLANAYQTIPVKLFQELVNLEGEDFADWVKLIGCTVNPDDSSLVDFPVTKDNQLRPTVIKETVKFEQLTKIIGIGRLTI